jgi:putative spermidine/putrescine transport system substrate-binding protein
MTSRKASFAAGLVVTASLAGIVSGAAAQSLPDLSGQSFVFAGFGGDLQSNQDIAWLQPFAEATGVTVLQTDAPNSAALATQQEAGNVTVDVIQIEASVVDANCGDMFVEVEIDRSELNSDLDTNACGVPVVKFSFVLAYNASLYDTAPTSIGDFFNTEEFPGVRVATSFANAGLIEAALLADGVAPSDIYPVDLDRALARIDASQDAIEFRDSFAIIQDGIASGEFDMALIPNGRALNASLINPDVQVTFGNAVTLFDNVAIPAGAENIEAATAFLQYTATHSTQVALAERFPYGVGTVGPAPNLSEEAISFFPDTYTDQLLVQDTDWWGENIAEVRERVNALFAQ